jgi:alanine dehydrogenase
MTKTGMPSLRLLSILQFVPDPIHTNGLLKKVTGIVCGMVQLSDGMLLLIKPMSEVAGRKLIIVERIVFKHNFSYKR